MHLVWLTLSVLLITGLVGALLLYYVSKQFAVREDPVAEEIAGLLPGANCGGCGFKGCRDFAAACASAADLGGIYCPVGGEPVMKRISEIVGLEARSVEPTVAVVKCNGCADARKRTAVYDGVRSCALLAAVSAGETGCAYGCLGCGDCFKACAYGAITMNPATGLPEIDAARCVSCGKCVSACPRHLIELRPKGRRDRRVLVACSSRDRGAVARKFCSVACIGCGKCAKVCPFGAITVHDNLSYIDPTLCKACGKCVDVCPTGAILSTFKQKDNEQTDI